MNSISSRFCPIVLLRALMAGLFCSVELRADDWPQWRGPSRDGVWRESGILESFPSNGLKIRWRARIGLGYSGPVLHKDRLLCLTAWNRGSFMLKLDAETPAASVVWKTRSQPSSTFSTPVFLDDKHFYLMDGGGNLCGLDAATGDEVWHSTEPVGGRDGTAHLTPHVIKVPNANLPLYPHRGRRPG
jgi:putative pyrroloquinoline-quinone binding quinoprotein